MLCYRVGKSKITTEHSKYNIAALWSTLSLWLSSGKYNSKYSAANLQASLEEEVTEVGAHIFEKNFTNPDEDAFVNSNSRKKEYQNCIPWLKVIKICVIFV